MYLFLVQMVYIPSLEVLKIGILKTNPRLSYSLGLHYRQKSLGVCFATGLELLCTALLEFETMHQCKVWWYPYQQM